MKRYKKDKGHQIYKTHQDQNNSKLHSLDSQFIYDHVQHKNNFFDSNNHKTKTVSFSK